MSLSQIKLERYSRQIVLPQIGKDGQEKLLFSKVIVVGVGGLGALVSLYLAEAGIGVLGIVDNDNVELDNLNRQVLYFEEDIGKLKVEIAKKKLQKINSEIKVISHHLRLDKNNILEIIKDYDIIVDCTDNFDSRFLINDACVANKKTLVHGAVLGFEGQVTSIVPGKSPCCRCLFDKEPPQGTISSCREAGVTGAVAGIVASIQSAEALKLILNIGTPLIGELLTFDALAMSFRKVKIPKNPNCPACSI